MLLTLASGVSAQNNTNGTANGSSFVWTITDTYAGSTFFE